MWQQVAGDAGQLIAVSSISPVHTYKPSLPLHGLEVDLSTLLRADVAYFKCCVYLASLICLHTIYNICLNTVARTSCQISRRRSMM